MKSSHLPILLLGLAGLMGLARQASALTLQADNPGLSHEATPSQRETFTIDQSNKGWLLFVKASGLAFQTETRDEDWARQVEASVREAVSKSSAQILTGKCSRSLCEYVLGNRSGDYRHLTNTFDVGTKIIAETKKDGVPVTIYGGRKDFPIHSSDPITWYLFRLTGPDDFMYSIPVEMEKLKAARSSMR